MQTFITGKICQEFHYIKNSNMFGIAAILYWGYHLFCSWWYLQVQVNPIPLVLYSFIAELGVFCIAY